jgi:hypothetical protein
MYYTKYDATGNRFSNPSAPNTLKFDALADDTFTRRRPGKTRERFDKRLDPVDPPKIRNNMDNISILFLHVVKFCVYLIALGDRGKCYTPAVLD